MHMKPTLLPPHLACGWSPPEEALAIKRGRRLHLGSIDHDLAGAGAGVGLFDGGSQ
jgi:hypothetical protein